MWSWSTSRTGVYRSGNGRRLPPGLRIWSLRSRWNDGGNALPGLAMTWLSPEAVGRWVLRAGTMPSVMRMTRSMRRSPMRLQNEAPMADGTHLYLQQCVHTRCGTRLVPIQRWSGLPAPTGGLAQDGTTIHHHSTSHLATRERSPPAAPAHRPAAPSARRGWF